MNKYFLLLVFFIFTGIHLFAQQNKQLFKDGDRVCFIGNSITHGGGFHQNIFLYYATRFPSKKISFFNAGVSGDVAHEILRRLDKDVLVHKPTVAVLMVGMNDVVRGFSADTSESRLKREHRMADTIALYKKNITRLAGRLTASGCKLILQLPSIYDQTVKNSTENMYGVNDALEKCAAFLKSIAPKYHAMVVDYGTIMKNINKQQQQLNPSFTIVSEDRVHPDPPGHLVMAYQFLKSTGASKYVSKILIDAKTKKINEAINCKIKLQTVAENKITFTNLEEALPYPVDEASSAALNYIPFNKELNQQILQVKNLLQGKYYLFIDEIKVGAYTAAELQNGINLATDTLTPQYKQSLEVLKYCDDYRNVYVDLRSIAVVEYRSLQDYTGPDDLESKKNFLNEKLEKIRGESYYDYVKQNCDAYPALKLKEAQLNEQLMVIRDAIYKVNQPQMHNYKIVSDKQ